MYVNRIELSELLWEDLQAGANPLVLGTNFTIYFGSTSDNVDPSILDGFPVAGGGSIRWVRDGSGGGDGVTLVTVVLGDGSSVKVPKALREHMTIDSDGDGLVNGLDSSPFDLVVFSQAQLVRTTPPYFRVEWYAAAGQTYQVQSATDLKAGNWTIVRTVQNRTDAPQKMILEDPLDPLVPSKNYRVVVRP